MNVSVRPHTRSKPKPRRDTAFLSMIDLLLGYVRTERGRQQEAALNRMALQINHVVEQDRLDGWSEADRQRVEQSF